MEGKTVLYIVFYIGIIPLGFLLHEIGYGLGVALTSKSQVHIYLGSKDKQNKMNFCIG